MRILETMGKPIPTRFSAEELAVLDGLVEQGVADNRSAVIRHAVARLAEAIEKERTDAIRREENARAFIESYRQRPETQTQAQRDSAMAAAVALVEAEPWHWVEGPDGPELVPVEP